MYCLPRSLSDNKKFPAVVDQFGKLTVSPVEAVARQNGHSWRGHSKWPRHWPRHLFKKPKHSISQQPLSLKGFHNKARGIAPGKISHPTKSGWRPEIKPILCFFDSYKRDRLHCRTRMVLSTSSACSAFFQGKTLNPGRCPGLCYISLSGFNYLKHFSCQKMRIDTCSPSWPALGGSR
jgi:hypothetical protein